MGKGLKKSRVAFVIRLNRQQITRFGNFKVSSNHCPAKFCRKPDIESAPSPGFPCVLVIKPCFATSAENFPKELPVPAVDH